MQHSRFRSYFASNSRHFISPTLGRHPWVCAHSNTNPSFPAKIGAETLVPETGLHRLEADKAGISYPGAEKAGSAR